LIRWHRTGFVCFGSGNRGPTAVHVCPPTCRS
jgi:hypothetical protein